MAILNDYTAALRERDQYLREMERMQMMNHQLYYGEVKMPEVIAEPKKPLKKKLLLCN